MALPLACAGVDPAMSIAARCPAAGQRVCLVFIRLRPQLNPPLGGARLWRHPGDAELWHQAALFVPETEEAVAALPLRVRRSLQNAEPSRSVLIRIDDDAPAERLKIRWRAALRICEPLLGDRTWRVVSLSPGLKQGVAWNHGRGPAGTDAL